VLIFSSGESKGRFEGKIEIATNIKQSGFDTATIAQITGLSKTDIDNL